MELVIFLAGQLIVVLLAVLSSHVKLATQMAELRGMVIQLQLTASSLKGDHSDLSNKVDGISRHVAQIEGMEMARSQSRSGG
jgi:hypothetical protein